MRRCCLLSLLFLFLSQAPDAQGEPAQGNAPQGEEQDLARYWDRDFDLILEYKQGEERRNQVREREVRRLEEEIRALREERDTLRSRRRSIEETYSTETLLEELMELEVESASEARKVLDEKIHREDLRIQDLERELDRLVREERRR